MKVSEVVAELTDHQPDGQVVVSEIDAVPDRVLVIESVVKEVGMLPLLMGRRLQSKAAQNSIFSESLFQKAFAAHLRGERRQHKTTIEKSVDGRYRVNVDGKMVPADFETESEAMLFLRGFAMGFESGAETPDKIS
jgi:hypothetical protein